MLFAQPTRPSVNADDLLSLQAEAKTATGPAAIRPSASPAEHDTNLANADVSYGAAQLLETV